MNVPGSGGPLVVTTMAAADVPQASVNSKVERTGRELALSTRLNTRAELSGITVLTGESADARFTVALSTLHKAVQVFCTVTEPVSVTFWLVLIDVKLCVVEVICTTGSMALKTVGSGVGAADGARVGAAEGTAVGIAVGFTDGLNVGDSVGRTVGTSVGAVEGCVVGDAVGSTVGAVVGAPEGS